MKISSRSETGSNDALLPESQLLKGYRLQRMPSFLPLMIDTIYAGFEALHYLISVISCSTWTGRAVLTFMSTFPISCPELNISEVLGEFLKD